MEIDEAVIGKELRNRKRKSRRKLDAGDGDDFRTSSRTVKGMTISMTKPSYILMQGNERYVQIIRFEHRNRLRRLLRKLVRRHNWDEAAAVLSVLLKGTLTEKSVLNNRTKYWATMELLQHNSNVRMIPRKIQHVYEIWMRKVIGVRSHSFKEKFMVQLEFIIFSLAHGDTESAYQTAMSLMQERGFGRDAISNLVVGLTFYQIWFTDIQKELQLNDLDESCTPMQSEMLGSRCNMSIDKSNAYGAVEVQEANSSFRCDSNTSIRIDKEIGTEKVVGRNREVPMEVDEKLQKATPKHEGFYLNSAESDGGEKSDLSDYTANRPFASIFYASALEPWLFPLRLPLTHDLDNFVYLQKRIHNENYKAAVKHLQIALNSTTPVFEALLPLIQMLLIGDQVKEAVDEVEKVVQNSDAALPRRLKASLLEHFNGNNCAKLWTCFEETLKRDPTCNHSLGRLIVMHHDGYYSAEKLLETIALHLDATYADFKTWKEFASCFLKLSRCEEDRMSVCIDGNNGLRKQSCTHHCHKIPQLFTDSISGKNWRLRCRWWLRRHFSQTILISEVASGELELLTYKAASATHLFGPEFDYVVKASACLKKEKNREMFSLLKMHKQNSVGFYLDFQKKK